MRASPVQTTSGVLFVVWHKNRDRSTDSYDSHRAPIERPADDVNTVEIRNYIRKRPAIKSTARSALRAMAARLDAADLLD